ncbi:BSD domain-containing protein 1-like [Montipora capricornis]|uniref:BSD domain-containing protein 1-like n=1 Tax=Montipora capricornis TaxID=246305 RepID=UPI0035F1303C
MAEESGGAGWWSAWGSEFIASVRNKSAEAMTMVKNDLSEFVCTIQHDTSSVVADTANAVKETLKVEEEEPEGASARIKQGVSKFFGSLSHSLKENISHVATAAAAVTSDGPEPVFDRTQAKLHEIQTDPATFCSEPDGHLGMYEEWCKTFDPEQCKGEISELLVNVPEVRALYAKLVPSAVSHVLFWQRYFYKVHQLEQEEKRRAALVARANQAQVEELGWGDDDLSDTEESEFGSIIAAQDVGFEDKVTGTGRGELTDAKRKELSVEVPGQSTAEPMEVARKLPDVLVNQEETVTSKEENQSQDRIASEKALDAKGHVQLLQELTDLAAGIIQQTSNTQPNTSNTSSFECPDGSTPETLKTVTEKIPDSGTLTASVHRRDNSSGSVDSSWSKVSEEELKADSEKEAVSKENTNGSGLSSQSSSSGVLVPGVDDKDLDWDEDMDLNGDDITEEEVKKIMQDISSSKQKGKDQEGGDLDDDDWENWD